MKKILFIILIFLPFSPSSVADSAGYGCYGHGIISWDKGSDRSGLYFVLFGVDSGISQEFRIELPRKHGSYSQGISCEQDRVSILLRGEKSQENQVIKYKMYVTDISVTRDNGPKIISDKANHYQMWGANYNGPRQVSLEDETSINLLEEADFWLDDCRGNNREKKSIRLNSDDEYHTYSLTFNYSNTFKPWENGGGKLTHRCVTAIEMRNTEGTLVDIVLIADQARSESIH